MCPLDINFFWLSQMNLIVEEFYFATKPLHTVKAILPELITEVKIRAYLSHLPLKSI